MIVSSLSCQCMKQCAKSRASWESSDWMVSLREARKQGKATLEFVHDGMGWRRRNPIGKCSGWSS